MSEALMAAVDYVELARKSLVIAQSAWHRMPGEADTPASLAEAQVYATLALVRQAAELAAAVRDLGGS